MIAKVSTKLNRYFRIMHARANRVHRWRSKTVLLLKTVWFVLRNLYFTNEPNCYILVLSTL